MLNISCRIKKQQNNTICDMDDNSKRSESCRRKVTGLKLNCQDRRTTAHEMIPE